VIFSKKQNIYTFSLFFLTMRIQKKSSNKDINETALLSEKALSECWNSQEDEETFDYLQKLRKTLG